MAFTPRNLYNLSSAKIDSTKLYFNKLAFSIKEIVNY